MQIVDEVKKVALEVQKSPAQVALAWLLSKSTVTSVLLGASKLEQWKITWLFEYTSQP